MLLRFYEFYNIRTDKPGRKVEAISTYPESRNVNEIRQFLRLNGLFQRFIEKYAILAEQMF